MLDVRVQQIPEEFASTVEAHLHEHRFQMVLRCVVGDEEARRDLPGVQASHHELGCSTKVSPAPYAGCWERSSDVTLYGAWGPIDKGIEAIDATLRWVAGRCSGGTQTQVELSTVFEQATLAYSVGFERTTLSIAGRAPRRMVLRVTQVYRSSDGEWRIVHRHADELPEDQRQLSD